MYIIYNTKYEFEVKRCKRLDVAEYYVNKFSCIYGNNYIIIKEGE